MNATLTGLACCLLLLCAGCKAPGDTVLAVSEPYAYAPLNDDGPGVAYLTLVNSGAAAVQVRGFSSDCFANAELHTSVMDNGISKMRPVEMIEVPALSSLSLRPGGLHLMLFGARESVSVGSNCRMTISYDDERSVTFEVALLDRSRYRPAEPVK